MRTARGHALIVATLVQINVSVWDHDTYSGDDFVSDLRISPGDITDPRLMVRDVSHRDACHRELGEL